VTQVCVEPRAVQDEKNALLVSAVEKAVGKRRSVVFFDPMETLCAKGVCGEVDEHNYLYSADGNHLNEYGMKLLGAQLRDLLESLQQ
jgi:lysophospholipase L1-like esterase